MTFSWNYLKPSTHAFEPTRLEAPLTVLLASLGADAARPDWRDAAMPRIDALVRTEIGPWAWGWRDYGGDTHMVIYNWCCPAHSLFPEGYAADKVAENVARIIAAVTEWRRYLESLERVYDAAAIPDDPQEGPRAIASASARIVTHVADITDCSDAWYACAMDAVGWFLEHLGISAAAAEAIVQRTFDGKFESWVEPAPAARDQATGDAAALAYVALKRAPP